MFFSRFTVRQRLGWLAAVIGAGIPIVLAVLGSSENPPSAATQGLLAFISVAAQIAAGWMFSRDGVVDKAKFQSSVRRLELLRQRAVQARRLTEDMVDDPKMDLASRREALGRLSVWASIIQEEVSEAMDDWFEAMPHAVDVVSHELASKEQKKSTHDDD
jgi:hypothetical protein